MAAKPKEITTFRMPPELMRWLGALAKLRGISRNKLVEETLRDKIDKLRDPEKGQVRDIVEGKLPYDPFA